jgi:membrane associated rhomboid family serine protease
MADPKRWSPLAIPLVLVGSIWAAFLVDTLLPWDAFRSLGLMPRSTEYAWGILAMPFVHRDWAHLTGNSVPLLVLSSMMVAVGRRWGTLLLIVVLSGVLLWLFGRGQVIHGGASGLVYGLAGLLIGLGIAEKKPLPILAAVAVAALYGGVLWAGVVAPGEDVSWDGHLAGAVAGLLAAGRRRRPILPPIQPAAS